MSPRAIAHGQAVVAFLDNLYGKTKDIPLSSVTDLDPQNLGELAEAATDAAVAVAATARLRPFPDLSPPSAVRRRPLRGPPFKGVRQWLPHHRQHHSTRRDEGHPARARARALALLEQRAPDALGVPGARRLHALRRGARQEQQDPAREFLRDGGVAAAHRAVAQDRSHARVSDGFLAQEEDSHLLALERRNLSSKEVIRDALVASDIAPTQLENIGRMSLKRWLSVFLPLPQPMAVSLSFPGVSKIRTVTYAHVGKTKTTKLLMDVYKHRDTPANAPIFLYIHGGGWVIGDRRIPPFTCVYQVASMGWVVCVIDYRLSPGVAFPTHLIDSKRAVAYLRHNAREEFEANPEFIVVGGESAGGHLASLMGLTADDKSLQPGFEEVDTSVRAVVDNYGVHDFTDRHGIYYSRDKTHGLIRYLEFLVMQKKLKGNSEDFERASPIAYLDDERAARRRDIIPPFMITHGTHDNTVAFTDSRVFFDRLRHFRHNLPQSISWYQDKQLGGVQDVFVKVPYASHMFNFLLSPRALAHGDAVCVFLDNVYRKTKDTPLEGRILPSHVEDIAPATHTSEGLSPASMARL
ncbi:hypothetical protein ON010_g5528 [Phytophthora cinnamomi]|nr:hypothetical protein ON010_g5528 [Phytophthora cinnamomi]